MKNLNEVVQVKRRTIVAFAAYALVSLPQVILGYAIIIDWARHDHICPNNETAGQWLDAMEFRRNVIR